MQLTNEVDSDELCGGLNVDPAIHSEGESDIAISLPIENNSPFVWRGTITLRLGKTPIPIGIGEIPPGETRTETVDLDLKRGSHDLNGVLSIGP